MPDRHPKRRNKLLALLSASDFALLDAHLTAVDLPRGYVIVNVGERIEWVYFFSSGIGSVIAVSPEGEKVEGGLFGRDGFSPTVAGVGGDISSHDIVVQVAGEGHRMPLEQFARVIQQSTAAVSLLTRFAHTLGTQATYTALSNAVHLVDERLARWLLMTHDRMDGDEMALTHEFISLMLAVRRPSVTTSLHALEGNKFIRTERGYITIRNRAALEEFARDAYGRPEEEYRRLIGPIR